MGKKQKKKKKKKKNNKKNNKKTPQKTKSSMAIWIKNARKPQTGLNLLSGCLNPHSCIL